MREVLDALDIDQANVIGHSMGGWLATLFGYESAHRVHKLVLVAAGGTQARPLASMVDWQAPSEETIRNGAGRTLAAIRAFGFKTLAVTVEELARPGFILILGVAPKRIDVITSIKGVQFPMAWRNRCRGLIREVPAWFLGRKELLRNKRSVARPQDLVDADLLTTPHPRRHRTRLPGPGRAS